MSVARNVICWRRLTGLFPSDTPGCNRSGCSSAMNTALDLMVCQFAIPVKKPFQRLCGYSVVRSSAYGHWHRKLWGTEACALVDFQHFIFDTWLCSYKVSQQFFVSNIFRILRTTVIKLSSLFFSFYWKKHEKSVSFLKHSDTIRDTILTCSGKLTWVSLIYRTEPTTKKCETEKL